MCTAVVGSARTCRVFDTGSAREDSSSDVCYVDNTRQSFSVKCDDSILHTHLVQIVSHRNIELCVGVCRQEIVACDQGEVWW